MSPATPSWYDAVAPDGVAATVIARGSEEVVGGGHSGEMEAIQEVVDVEMAEWRRDTMVQMQEDEDIRVACRNSLETGRREAEKRLADERIELDRFASFLGGYISEDSCYELHPMLNPSSKKKMHTPPHCPAMRGMDSAFYLCDRPLCHRMASYIKETLRPFLGYAPANTLL
jgi:hypothetical protein